jgi:L,D-peptidoglycan transpeptidase YkuD (ErfK/YbiS/YcfS/YnhG family)
MTRAHSLAVSLFFSGCVIFCAPSAVRAQSTHTPAVRTVTAQPIPVDARILKEVPDGKGNILRTYQYTSGQRTITETRLIPGENYGYRVPLNPDTLNRDSLMVLVTKTRYKVEVYYRKNLVRVYKAVCGPRPEDNKTIEGDRCTPEGWFRITQKNPASHYHKFLLIDYPNDSTNARLDRLKNDGRIARDARPGSAIGIHGVFRNSDDLIDKKVGWTDGCIALRNKDIDDLYHLAAIGTRVFIRK